MCNCNPNAARKYKRRRRAHKCTSALPLMTQAFGVQNYLIQVWAHVDGLADSLAQASSGVPRAPRPRHGLAVLQAIRGSSGFDVVYILIGVMSIVMILCNETMSGWVAFGWFMCGVSALLAVVQRGGLAYHNQTLMWLGAPKPPLPLHEDSVAATAIVFRSIFQLVAVLLMWGGW